LMAGSLRSYFTMDVYGGLMRLPTVLYSLITYCSVVDRHPDNSWPPAAPASGLAGYN
jgi:hypothetical protein